MQEKISDKVINLKMWEALTPVVVLISLLALNVGIFGDSANNWRSSSRNRRVLKESLLREDDEKCG
jgi:hypothetical protein